MSRTLNVHHAWHAKTTDVLTHALVLVVRVPFVMLFKAVPDAPALNSTKEILKADAILNAQLMMTAHHTRPASSFNVSTPVMEPVV